MTQLFFQNQEISLKSLAVTKTCFHLQLGTETRQIMMLQVSEAAQYACEVWFKVPLESIWTLHTRTSTLKWTFLLEAGRLNSTASSCVRRSSSLVGTVFCCCTCSNDKLYPEKDMTKKKDLSKGGRQILNILDNKPRVNSPSPIYKQ